MTDANTSSRNHEATLTRALDAWQRELAAGKRTVYTLDPLWRAACAELNALEATPDRRASYIREARNILVAEAKRRGAA